MVREREKDGGGGVAVDAGAADADVRCLVGASVDRYRCRWYRRVLRSYVHVRTYVPGTLSIINLLRGTIVTRTKCCQ